MDTDRHVSSRKLSTHVLASLGAHLVLAFVAPRSVRAEVRVAAADAFQPPEDTFGAPALRGETIITLAEIDHGRAVEHQLLQGADSLLRRAGLTRMAFTVRQKLGDDAAARVGGAKVVDVTVEGVEDFNRPLQTTVVLENIGAANTQEHAASVEVSLRPVIEPVQNELDFRMRKKPGVAGELPGKPTQVSWTFRIIPPLGFVHDDLPVDRQRHIGSTTLFESFEAKSDASIEVKYALEAPSRLTATEAASLSVVLRAVSREPVPTITFHQVAAALIARGDIPEGLAEYARVAAAHPTHGIHESQYAVALVTAGMGIAGRKHALRAVEIEPDRPAGHRVLAWVLSHDLLGGLTRSSRDLEGAAREYEATLASGPNDLIALKGLMNVRLSQADADPTCRPDAELIAKAIAAGTRLHDLKWEQGSDDDYLRALFRAHRWKELREAASHFEHSHDRDTFLAASVAVIDGVDGGLAQIAQDTAQPPSAKAVAEAAYALVNVREYDTAGKLLATLPAPKPREAFFLKALPRVHRIPTQVPVQDSKSLFAAVMVRAYANEVRPVSWSGLIDGPPELATAVVQELRPQGKPDMFARLEPLAIADVAATAIAIQERPGPEGSVRLEISSPPIAVWIARHTERGLVLIANLDEPGVVGAEALRCADAGDWDGASAWLDLLEPSSGPKQTGIDAFDQFWPPRPEADRKRAVQLAAAELSVRGPARAHAVQVFERLYPALTGRDRAAAAVGWVRSTEGSKQSAALVLARITEGATFFRADQAVGFSLVHAPDERSRCEIAQRRLDAVPTDADAAATFELCEAKLNLPAGLSYGKSQVGSVREGPPLLNNLLFADLFVVPRDPQLESLLARAAPRLTAPHQENTLAVAFAATGKLDDALKHFNRSVASHNDFADEDWLAYGRLAQAYGLRADALEAYGHIKRDDDPLSAYALSRVFSGELQTTIEELRHATDGGP